MILTTLGHDALSTLSVIQVNILLKLGYFLQ